MRFKSKRTIIIILALIIASTVFYGIYNLLPSTNTQPTKKKPLVYFELKNQLGATGNNSTLTSQLISYAGGINIAENETLQYVTLTNEHIILKNPDIIIKFYQGAEPNEEEMNMLKEEIMNRPGWNEINAVKNGKVYIIHYAESSINPRLVMGLIRYAKWIHPELFQDIDIDEVKEYIDNIYGLTTSNTDTQPTSTIMVIDGWDRNVTIKYPAERVVSLASSVSEVICAINASYVLVGVDKYSTFPPYLKDKINFEPGFNVGSGATPSLELIVAQDPDVVFAWQYCTIIDQIEDQGIPVYVLEYPQTVSEVIGMIKTIGSIVGKEDEAEEISGFITGYVDMVKDRTEGL